MANPTCAFGSGCGLTGLALCLVWWLGGSALLWITWNKVIAALTSAKQAKYWQALLFVATASVLICLPSAGRRWGACGAKYGCHYKGGCPYHMKAAPEAVPQATPGN